MSIPTRPGIEVLEDRNLLTTFGALWPNPGQLTLSFAPDQTQIGSHQNNLFSTLDQHYETEVWQTEILRAFQTWAVESNINIGLVADNGLPFGAFGLTQGDPRFGSIRIGGFQQGNDVLAVAVPPDPTTGTWAGDVLLSTAYRFGLEENLQTSTESSSQTTGDYSWWSWWGHNHHHHYPENTAPEGTDTESSVFDLFTVFLHEAGHALGLPGSQDPSSALASYTEAKAELSEGDVSLIQQWYGTRSHDAYEGSKGNNSFWRKTDLGAVSSSESIDIFADITTGYDVDYYLFKTSGSLNGLTIEVDTNGYSLLAPEVSVHDLSSWWSPKVGSDSSSGPLDDDLSVYLSKPGKDNLYLVKVKGATDDVFGIGGYRLKIHEGTEPEPQALDAFFAGYALDDYHTNDDFDSATLLASAPGYADYSHYEAMGSISNAADLDFYRFVVPGTEGSDLRTVAISVESLELDGGDLATVVYDANGQVVESRVIQHVDSRLGLEVDLVAGAEHYVQVHTTASEGDHNLGNYALVISGMKDNLSTVFTATLDASNPSLSFTKEVSDSNLMHYQLSAESVDPNLDAWISITATDANGNVLLAGEMKVNEMGEHQLILTPGTYTVHLELWSQSGAPLSPVLIRIEGIPISDPIGPETVDPTNDPSQQSTTSVEPPPEEPEEPYTAAAYSSAEPTDTESSYSWYSGSDPYSDSWWSGGMFSSYYSY